MVALSTVSFTLHRVMFLDFKLLLLNRFRLLRAKTKIQFVVILAKYFGIHYPHSPKDGTREPIGNFFVALRSLLVPRGDRSKGSYCIYKTQIIYYAKYRYYCSIEEHNYLSFEFYC